MYEWDEAKRRANLAKHGVDFADLVRLEWSPADLREDTRNDYGERRFVVDGYIDGRQHVLAFVWRNGRVRAISLRKANARERKRYEQAKKLH